MNTGWCIVETGPSKGDVVLKTGGLKKTDRTGLVGVKFIFLVLWSWILFALFASTVIDDFLFAFQKALTQQ